MLIGTAAQEIHHCKLCHMAWASFEQEIAQAPGLFGGFPIVRDRYAVAAHPAPLSSVDALGNLNTGIFVMLIPPPIDAPNCAM